MSQHSHLQAPTGLKGLRLQIDGEGTVGVEGDISVAEGVVERQGGRALSRHDRPASPTLTGRDRAGGVPTYSQSVYEALPARDEPAAQVPLRVCV
ncbi:hypothetical protein DZA28_15385 [Pseudomonas alloputida]|uniref:Uncharacterized protein n=2 Tax=Pseudomonas TaxID=286 RepID=A0ABD6NAD2_9PSED|nr:hypothetical protein [Pseudomonas hunanensis]PTV63124.1 hypothetical protein DBL03_08480 [Pseudomonas putida]TRZ61254.1 hypothetical protein DZA28_15385 [Pseudomonas alloputida]